MRHFSLFAVMGAPAEKTAKADTRFLSPVLADGINDAATFGLEAAEVTVFDVNGREVAHETSELGSVITWDGRDRDGRVVPSGVYVVKIRRRDGGTEHQSLAVVK